MSSDLRKILGETYTSLEGSEEMLGHAVEALISDEYLDLTAPPGLEGRRFLMSYRSLPYRPSREYPRATVFADSEWEGTQRVILLDIFEAVTLEDGSYFLMPVGYCDYRVAENGPEGKYPEGGVASHHKNSHIGSSEREYGGVWGHPMSRHFLNLDTGLVNNPHALAGELADFHAIRVWNGRPGYLAQAVPSRFPARYQETVKQTLERDYRGYGFGALLEAMGILVLQRQGVTEIAFYTGITPRLKAILRQLGTSPKSWGDRVSIAADRLPKQPLHTAIAPFIARNALIDDMTRKAMQQFDEN